MVVLGVVLVLLALAVGILLVAGVASLEGTVDVSVPGGTLSLPPLTFLVTGMVVISVFWLGWVVLRTGVRHSRRRRAEAKEAAKEAEAKRVAEERRLKEEFAARERQLIEERRRHEAETAQLTGEHPVGAPAADPSGEGAGTAAGTADPGRTATPPGRDDRSGTPDAGVGEGADRDGKPEPGEEPAPEQKPAREDRPGSRA